MQMSQYDKNMMTEKESSKQTLRGQMDWQIGKPKLISKITLRWPLEYNVLLSHKFLNVLNISTQT